MIRPLVSVCIPVYNSEAFVAAAVASVLKQTFNDFELIVLDNASTDGTSRILAQFDDARLRIIRHTFNIGAVANFNTALSEARGEWVKILCADDLLYPDCLEQQLQDVVLCGKDPPVLLCCARDVIDAGTRRWMRRAFSCQSGAISGVDAVRRSVCAGTNLFGEPAAVLMNRDAALKAGGFNSAWHFCTDLDLWVRILQYGNLYANATSLCAFRVSAQSWSISLVRVQANEFCLWMKRCQQSGLLHATHTELLGARIRAYVLMMQRWAFYKVVNGRG